MQTTIELPDAIYREGERIAQAKGFTLEELIVHALKREFSRGDRFHVLKTKSLSH